MVDIDGARVYVAGHRGMVGRAIVRALEARGGHEIIGWPSAEVDLRDEDAAMDAVTAASPDVVVVAAARVGGILANATHPVSFLDDNLRIQSNVMSAAHAAGVDRLLFLGSSCIYPRHAPQPIPESALLTGPLESTNQAYAIAKIAGIIGVQSYRQEFGRRWISAMPSNLYGPFDNFDPETSHVLPGMIRKFHDAVATGGPVMLWGTGTPRREFLHVDDVASACIHLLEHYDDPTAINVGAGQDISISELAGLVAGAVGYGGEVAWDRSRPDGTPRKVLDVRRLSALGWHASIGLREGIAGTVEWYREHAA